MELWKILTFALPFAVLAAASGPALADDDSRSSSIGKRDKAISGGQELGEPAQPGPQKYPRQQKEAPETAQRSSSRAYGSGPAHNQILGSWHGTYYCHGGGQPKGTISLTVTQSPGGGFTGSEQFSRGMLGGTVQHSIEALDQGRYRFSSRSKGFASFPYQVAVQYSGSGQLVGKYINHPNCDKFVLQRD